MSRVFSNRSEAGKLLAKKLTVYAKHPDVLVLGLPRGGVPVAFEVATALKLPLDICLVRKLGVPGHSELAMGALASGGVIVLNEKVIQKVGISQEAINKVAEKENQELLRRERTYRGRYPLPNLGNRMIILVDDGIATGSTLQAAISTLRRQRPKKIVVAVPVAPPLTYDQLKKEVDEVVCLITPEPLYAIGLWYKDFSQTTDQEVSNLLAQANSHDQSRSINSPSKESGERGFPVIS